MSVTSAEEQDLNLCAALQQEEWEVLESIYPDYISGDISQRTIKLEIPVELPGPRLIASIDEDSSNVSLKESFTRDTSLSPHSPSMQLQSLSTLPPLLLDIILPDGYPLYGPPQIISLHATHSWLSDKFGLQRYLMDMWQAGEGVLYTWIECIRNGEFLETFRLMTTLNGDQAIRIPHPELKQLIPLLVAYDTWTQQMRFSQNSYNCEICLTSIKGARCILLSCSHVFCRSCLEDFWKMCIAEGDVSRVGCPDPGCVKDLRGANEEEVRRVVTAEEVGRWKWLRQKQALEKDPTMVHCPVSFCQTPVPKPSNVEDGTGWERLRECPECSYSFCAYCKRTWHGSLTECPISATEGFVLQYMALPEDAEERIHMERRYGRANIRRLVAKYEEDRANRKWLEESTMACPGCRIHVEKSHGCNHMTCNKCGQHFCYRCGEKLGASDPYQHFSTPGHGCYSKLFDFQSIEDEWQPVEGFDVV